MTLLPFAPLKFEEIEERYLDDVRRIVAIVREAAEAAVLTDDQTEQLLRLGASSNALLDARDVLLGFA